jgi:hypothetical protein
VNAIDKGLYTVIPSSRIILSVFIPNDGNRNLRDGGILDRRLRAIGMNSCAQYLYHTDNLQDGSCRGITSRRLLELSSE